MVDVGQGQGHQVIEEAMVDGVRGKVTRSLGRPWWVGSAGHWWSHDWWGAEQQSPAFWGWWVGSGWRVKVRVKVSASLRKPWWLGVRVKVTKSLWWSQEGHQVNERSMLFMGKPFAQGFISECFEWRVLWFLYLCSKCTWNVGYIYSCIITYGQEIQLYITCGQHNLVHINNGHAAQVFVYPVDPIWNNSNWLNVTVSGPACQLIAMAVYMIPLTNWHSMASLCPPRHLYYWTQVLNLSYGLPTSTQSCIHCQGTVTHWHPAATAITPSAAET